MGDLGRRLRELGKDQFESFVHQYLLAQYPGANIKRVEGSGGDLGIDAFQGLLSDGPAIWQSKHFPDRIRKSQKEKILSSIATAAEHKPKLWTLCVPIDFRAQEWKWFESEVILKNGGPSKVKLLQASHFIAELNQNRRLLEAFFPEEILSGALNTRRVLLKTDGKTPDDLGLLVTEYAQQYLESAMELDPRLEAVVAVGRVRPLNPFVSQPGLVFSVAEGEGLLTFMRATHRPTTQIRFGSTLTCRLK